jgi:hypothetical protein
MITFIFQISLTDIGAVVVVTCGSWIYMYLIQHYVLKVCQWLVAGGWVSLYTLVSSYNKTDSHNIAEILLKVALNTTSITHLQIFVYILVEDWDYIVCCGNIKIYMRAICVINYRSCDIDVIHVYSVLILLCETDLNIHL